MANLAAALASNMFDLTFDSLPHELREVEGVGHDKPTLWPRARQLQIAEDEDDADTQRHNACVMLLRRMGFNERASDFAAHLFQLREVACSEGQAIADRIRHLSGWEIAADLNDLES